MNDFENKLLLVVRNIPKTFRAVDLRNHFSHFVTNERFKCFHYLGRRELLVKKTDDVNKSVVASDTCVCIVEMSNERDAFDFIQQYNGLEWRNAKSEFVNNTICIIQRISIGNNNNNNTGDDDEGEDKEENENSKKKSFKTQKEKSETMKKMLKEPNNLKTTEIVDVKEIFKDSSTKRVALLELHPPRALPRGNVGTPAPFISMQISKCLISPSELARSGLLISELRKANRQKVAFDYEADNAKRRRRVANNTSFDVDSILNSNNNNNNENNSTTTTTSSSSTTTTSTTKYMSRKERRAAERRRLAAPTNYSKEVLHVDLRPEAQPHLASAHATQVDTFEQDHRVSQSKAADTVDDRVAEGEETWDIYEKTYDSGSRAIGQNGPMDPGSPRFGRVRESQFANFEEPVEVTWDKGSSGLVFHMTADLSEPTDTDERHVADWSVLAPESTERDDDDDPARLRKVARKFRAKKRSRAEQDADDAQRAQFFESVRQAYKPGQGGGLSFVNAIADKGSFADFEKYTAARGSSMMRNMGWQYGTGLGKHNEGDPEPVRVRDVTQVDGMAGVVPTALTANHRNKRRTLDDDSDDSDDNDDKVDNDQRQSANVHYMSEAGAGHARNQMEKRFVSAGFQHDHND